MEEVAHHGVGYEANVASKATGEKLKRGKLLYILTHS